MVLNLMNALVLIFAAAALFLGGCATTPTPVQRPTEPWPESVADSCPQRTVLLECWIAPPSDDTFLRLTEKLRSCQPPGAEPVEVRLEVETRGGTPSCVGWEPRDSETARCVAGVFARHLVIAKSPPDERCSFTYPVRFE